ncbi:MAG TPA: ABC transporter permease [Candidatus Methylomirabilis sp.]|nr:ABC transporter permease [Candidatus Methylomirabilis sp.]
MNTLVSDVRHGMRVLLRHPSHSAVILVVLAVAIGANSAIYTVAHETIFRPLPFRDPDHLVAVWEVDPTAAQPRQLTPPEDFEVMRHDSHSLESVAAIVAGSDIAFDIASQGEPQRVPGALVSAGFFSMLGVKPLLGRTFLPEEDNAGSDHVVVLSADLFGAKSGVDKSIMGNPIVLNGKSYTVVGVMPPGFHYPGQAQVWLPNPQQADLAMNLGFHFYPYFRVVARLDAGTTLKRAQTEMDVIARQLTQGSVRPSSTLRVLLVPLRTELYGDFRSALLVLLCAVGLVLLIACANVSNLLLARATTRQAEFALRMSLGASRSRLFGQLLTESLELALLGGVLGLLVSKLTLNWLTNIVPPAVPLPQALETDLGIVLFTFLVTISAAILFGFAPFFSVSQLHLTSNFKSRIPNISPRTARRARRVIVIAEIGLALVLFVAASLMMRTFWALTRADLGFNPQNVLTLTITLPGWKYKDSRAQAAFFHQALGRLKQVPGIAEVGLTTALPLQGEEMQTPFLSHEGAVTHGSQEFANVTAVSPDFFKALGVPLLSGRLFEERDDPNAPPVAIIDDFTAARLNKNAVGSQIAVEGSMEKPGWRTVVGVVKQVKQSLWNPDSGIVVYIPYSQSSIPLSSMRVVARKSQSGLNLESTIRREIWKVDRDQPITNVETMTQLVALLTSQQRFATILLGIFGSVAFFLAAIGVYGVMSFSVAQRSHEFGVRLAVGASHEHLLWLVIREGISASLWGVGLGLACYAIVARLLSTMLYGVAATDPLVLGGAMALLTAVGVFASYLPARRATRIDPLVALRYE